MHKKVDTNEDKKTQATTSEIQRAKSSRHRRSQFLQGRRNRDELQEASSRLQRERQLGGRERKPRDQGHRGNASRHSQTTRPRASCAAQGRRQEG